MSQPKGAEELLQGNPYSAEMIDRLREDPEMLAMYTSHLSGQVLACAGALRDLGQAVPLAPVWRRVLDAMLDAMNHELAESRHG